MGFYSFQLDRLSINHQRGNIPDDDAVTFTVFVDERDRGHGSGRFASMATHTIASTRDRTSDGFLAYPTNNASRFNISENWQIGPLEIDPQDKVSVVYTGINTSDEQLGLSTQKQDELELKVLDYIAKKYVELIAGVEFGSDIGSALSEAFDKAFKDPIGDLVGYRVQGPCNGPVFSGAVNFRGSELRQLNFTPLPPPGPATPPLPSSSTISFTNSYTDDETHDSNICGHRAETDVTFSVLRISFISVRWSLQARFPSRYPDAGLRQYGKPGTEFSIKALLGLRP